MFLLLYSVFQRVEAFPCYIVGALTVTKKLLEHVSTYGVPSVISNDRGPHFTVQIVKALRKAPQTSGPQS